MLVRHVPHDAVQYLLLKTSPPFTVHGAPNVILETVKRGEFDDYSSTSTGVTVVLRLYEAFGGHAKAILKIGGHIPVLKACITNLLEDETQQIQLLTAEDPQDETVSLKLDFHGFEVKTVKVTIGRASTIGPSSA